MKITFDSNVWRIISSPDKFPNEKSIDDFRKIRKAIVEKKIDPFICETVFTLEAIKRQDRKKFFSENHSKTNIDVTDDGSSEMVLTFSIRPDRTVHPGNHRLLDVHLKDAIDIGFKILKFPRIGGVVNRDIENLFYNHEDLKSYFDNAFSVAREIESKSAGIFHIKVIGLKYDKYWKEGIKKASDREVGNIAKAVAEWADGDSVACHIAVKGDFFCTRDNAQKAGDNSVLSKINLSWLKATYNFAIITPEDLAKKC
jgi:hypothetical protein